MKHVSFTFNDRVETGRKHPLVGIDDQEGTPLNDKPYKRIVDRLVEEESHGS